MTNPRIIEVLDQINRGSSGIIDRVRLEDGTVAVRKTFNPIDYQSVTTKVLDQRRARFIREVKTQASLDSSYFIPILGADLRGPNPWFVMPIADDEYASEIESAKNEKRIPNGLSDILNALEVLHDLGLTHRDIKPQNILLHEGLWKLSDFGLITHDKSVTSNSITSTDAWAGTQSYMAPEQLHEFRTVNEKADIYSFGAILHDIFGNGPRTPYSKLTAPGAVGFIIEKCTEEKPEKRFRNVASLRAALLTQIAKEETIRPSEELSEWLLKLKDCQSWNEETFEQFLFMVKKLDDAAVVWYEFGGKAIDHLQTVDLSLWGSLVKIYLDWINDSSFAFDYCDVLAGRISRIYALSESVEIKCSCIISCARLGSSHNRFYVMRILSRLASGEINENLASRVALEISIDPESLAHHFIACAKILGRDLNQYHQLIHDELKKPVDYNF